ncbi:platelet glycoprotein 4 isoform X1 [Stigmatopora argus]
MGCCNRSCGLIAGIAIGAALALLGGILFPVGDNLIVESVLEEAVIQNGTPTYENWLTQGGGTLRQFWFFDVQNAREVVEEGATPVVVEKGPYSYWTRYLPKMTVKFNPNDTVSYSILNEAVFEPLYSSGTEMDVISTLNLAVAGSYSIVPKYMHYFLEKMIKSSNSSLFQRRTVRELLWGYRDPMLKTKVGLFSPYNYTFDGPYNIFTGKDDVTKVGTIDKWRRSRTLDFWNDTYCNMINGTDGSNFAPYVDATKPLYFFSSDICRSVSASYERSLELKGIPVYRFTLLASTLASPLENPDNHCYCRDLETTKNCSMAGVLDISSCQKGQPIYISLPHFLHGSPSLLESVKGLKPILDEHDTYLQVEPMTGITLGFSKKIQVNMMYGPSKVITVLKKVNSSTIFPLVWMNESAELDDESATMLKMALVDSITMLDVIRKLLLGVGLFIFALCLILYIVVRCKGKRIV